MAAIIHQKDKRSGITYAYESISYWDKEKKQSRAKRKLIGRVDETTGEVVPTDGRGHRRGQAKTDVSTGSTRSFYGATYLLDAVGEKIGIDKDLKACFPDTYKQILSLAYYLILEESTPLFRFEKWSQLHRHPFGENIPSQRSSELFASIKENAKEKFFLLQSKRRVENEYWAYDTTSISSYSEQLSQAQYGHNKESDPLPQINLAIVFGESSNLPFYYRKLSGNIPDVHTLKQLLRDLKQMGTPKVKLVMDRGFYSKANIDMLYKNHQKFLISLSMSLKLARDTLEPIYDTFRSFDHYNPEYELYHHTVATTWGYEAYHPTKKETLKAQKRIYVHYYYNIEKAAEDEKRFDRRLIELQKEILEDRRLSKHEKLYTKYFTIKQTPKRGIKATIKDEAVQKAKRYFGFFSLISNDTMDAITALEIYRNKDVVEKAFGNLKERLNMRRMLVSSEQSLEGKLFVEFVALIYLSYIKKQMQVHKLFKTYTLQSLLDQVDVIECFERPGHRLQVGEILQKQKKIYEYMGVEVPG
jgi:transposase